MASGLDDLAPRPDPYVRDPFRVTVYSCQDQRPIRTVYFLGGVPKNVLAAARRGQPSARLSDPNNPQRWPNTTWKAADAEVLKRHYGPGWRSVLIPELDLVLGAGVHPAGLEPAPPPDRKRTGGAEEEFDFGNLGSLNQIDEEGTILIDESQLGDVSDLSSKPKKTRPAEEEFAETADASRKPGHPGDTNPATVYSNLGVHPRDSLADLEEKIYLATGIPPVRQHLFWDAEGQVRSTYKFSSAGVPQEIDIRRFGQSEGMHIAELPVDATLAAVAERGEVFVEALDNFRLVDGAARGRPLHHAYVCDFNELVAPRRRELATVVGDRLQADLLYRGLVLKYWPKYSLDAMVLALTSGDLREVFPNLAPHRPSLEERHQAQDAILDKNRTSQESVYRRYATKRSLGVTSATVQVEPYSAGRAGFGDQMRINIRNVFDLFSTSTAWPAAVARFFLTSSAQGGWSRQDAVAVKTHVSAAPGGNDDSAEIQRAVNKTVLKRSLMIVVRTAAGWDEAPSTSCGAADPPQATGLVNGAWLKGRARLVYFTLRDDGAYTLESSWPEDQRLPPAEVVRKLSEIVRPLVETINQMGLLAFPTGGELYLPALSVQETSTGSNFRVRGITASAFWPRALTEGAFRALKSRWREYERAGMVHIKGLQQAGAFAFQVTKGIVDYDPRAIERTIIVSTVSGPGGRTQTVREFAERTQNTYSYLSDPIIAQRWGHIYPGRTVRFYHRTSDLKIELVNVSDRELNWLWGLVFCFLDSLTTGSDKVPGIQLPNQARQDLTSAARGRPGGLRALQDRDPDLYDVRKYDSSATVYSVLCQNPRPPVLHTPEEAAQLTSRRQKRLVKYWNFTEKRPAFYECTHPNFPHLSFLEGRHPKGYGLPCCQKTVAHPGSRREKINQQFLEMFSSGVDASDEAGGRGQFEDGASRHVLSYGKRIAPGRVASLAKFFEEELFFQTLPSDWSYKLWGVQQTLPALPQAGFYHAVAEIVDEPFDALARQFAWAVVNMGGSYSALARGRAGGLFLTPQSLAEELVSTFAPGEDPALFTAFSPGAPAHDIWEELVEDLTQICYGVYLAVIEDDDGTTSHVNATARAAVLARMRNHDEDSLGVIFKIGHPEGKRSAGGIYPLVIQSTGGPGAKAANVQKQVVSLFGGDDADPTAGLATVLREVLLSGRADEAKWDLHALAQALGRKEFSNYRVVRKLVGRRDLCYGVVLGTARRPAGAGGGARTTFYVPIVSSPHSHDDELAPFTEPSAEGSGAHYGPRSTLPKTQAPSGGAPRAVREFLDLLAATPAGKTNLTIDGNLRTVQGQSPPRFVGVTATFGETPLNYYHEPAAQALYPRLPEASLPVLPVDIDAALWDMSDAEAKKKKAEPQVSPGALRAVYLSSLYRLFLSEFSSWIYRNRNTAVRGALVKIAEGAAQSGTPEETQGMFKKFRTVIEKAVNNDPDSLEGDLRKLRSIVSCLRTRTRKQRRGQAAGRADLSHEEFTCMLNNTSFDFDLQLLHQLRRAPPAEAAAEVRKVMDTRVELVPLDQIVAEGHAGALLVSGVYASCHDWPQSKCGLPSPCRPHPEKGRVLGVPPERYDGLISLLVAEIQNPLQWDSFIFQTSGVIDDLDFIRRPGERIEIRL